jgi:hypothetical protein
MAGYSLVEIRSQIKSKQELWLPVKCKPNSRKTDIQFVPKQGDESFGKPYSIEFGMLHTIVFIRDRK